MFFLQRWLWWCVEFYIFKGRAGLLQYTQVLFFLKQFHSLCYKIHIHIIYLFIMLQDSWWKSRVDGCKNSPSFASSSSAPSPSHGSSPPEQGTSTKSPQIPNTLLIIVYHIYYILYILLHRHHTDHLLLQRTSTKTPQISNILSNNLSPSSLPSLQLLPENNCFLTFLFSFCFFFFSLTISRSSMVSSKESPDFVACGGNGSFTTTWQRNVKSNTTAFGNSFTALLISVIFGNFRLLCAVYGKFLQHLQFLQRSVVSGFMTWKLFRWKAREIGFDLIKSAISADSV